MPIAGDLLHWKAPLARVTTATSSAAECVQASASKVLYHS